MCVVSAVYDGLSRIPLEQWTFPALNDVQKIIRLLEDLDKKLGQADCQDPQKAEVLKKILAYLESEAAK